MALVQRGLTSFINYAVHYQFVLHDKFAEQCTALATHWLQKMSARQEMFLLLSGPIRWTSPASHSNRAPRVLRLAMFWCGSLAMDQTV